MKHIFLLLVLLALSSINTTQAFDAFNTPDMRVVLQNMNNSFLIKSKNELSRGFECRIESVILEGIDPVNSKKQAVELKRYIPVHPLATQKQLLLIPPTSPPRGAATVLDKWYASNICKKGLTVNILDNWDGYEEKGLYDFGTHDRASIRAIHVGLMALGYIKNPVFMFGTSLGAIYSSFLIGISEQVKGGVLIAGGDQLPEMITISEQEVPRVLRDIRMANFPQIKTQENYRALVYKNVRLSPEDFIAPEKSENIFIVKAENDNFVNTPFQDDLWVAWGKPTHIDHDLNHIHTIIGSFLLDRNTIVKFLINKMNH